MAEGKTQKKNLIIAILAIILLSLVGTSAFLLTKFSSKPGTYIHLNSKGNYVLVVDGKPFMVKGVCYSPVPIGESYLYNWWNNRSSRWI